jgi:hypothetical protein
VVVSPRGGEVPTDEERRAAYFDVIHHAAGIVGLNTSTFVEAAIIGRPCFTILDARYQETQEGTLHFEHIAGPRGVLVVARDWDEHLDQLTHVLEEPHAHDQRVQGFVRHFIRPRGLESPAAPFAVDAIEALCR